MNFPRRPISWLRTLSFLRIRHSPHNGVSSSAKWRNDKSFLAKERRKIADKFLWCKIIQLPLTPRVDVSPLGQIFKYLFPIFSIFLVTSNLEKIRLRIFLQMAVSQWMRSHRQWHIPWGGSKKKNVLLLLMTVSPHPPPKWSKTCGKVEKKHWWNPRKITHYRCLN